MKVVKFEKRKQNVLKLKDSINYIAESSRNKNEAFSRLADIMPSDVKIGFGGSHIWVSNQQDERILIITGF